MENTAAGTLGAAFSIPWRTFWILFAAMSICVFPVRRVSERVDAAEGFVVDFSAEQPLVTDGPYGETKELFNGFWIIEVSSREEAAQWASRAPLGAGAFLEVRRVTEMEDFPADNEWIQKEEGWREEQAQRAAGA